jgi:hypothetical protein
MTAAEVALTATFRRFWKNWATILSLRQVADVAIPIAAQPLSAIHRDFVDQLSVDPQYKKIIVNLDGSEATWDDDTKNLLRTAMTAGVMTSAKAAIDAASLVFAHSVLDDSAWSYLRVCAIACPADWEPIIAEKKVSFADLGRSLDAIRHDMIREKIERMERESLLKKVDLLFQLCRPPKDYAPVNDYVYDRGRLEKIDDARNGIIHKDGIGKALDDIEDDLDFIRKTANYLLALVNRRYGVQVVATLGPLPPEDFDGKAIEENSPHMR